MSGLFYSVVFNIGRKSVDTQKQLTHLDISALFTEKRWSEPLFVTGHDNRESIVVKQKNKVSEHKQDRDQPFAVKTEFLKQIESTQYIHKYIKNNDHRGIEHRKFTYPTHSPRSQLLKIRF